MRVAEGPAGIPIVLGSAPGPVTGGLVFRVGIADEELATYGITHLVEHLALSELNLSAVHSNGRVSDTTTVFHATGSLGEVTVFLSAVCRTLAQLPTHRWQTEAKVLRAEAAQRRPHWGEYVDVWRHGATGRGLRSQEAEWGLLRLSDGEIADWTRRYFTRGNVVAYLTTDQVPPGLDLRLPDGPRVPLPPGVQAVATTPATVAGPLKLVAMEGVTVRTPATDVFVSLLDQAVFRDVRIGAGLTYTPVASATDLDAHRVEVSIAAECAPGEDAALTRAMAATAVRLGDGRFTAAELSDAITATLRDRQALHDPQAVPALLCAAASSLVRDGMIVDQWAVDRAIQSVTPDQVVTVARQWWSSALILTGAPDALGALQVHPARLALIQPIGVGRDIAEFDQPGVMRSALQIGPQALTYGSHRTVAFQDVVGLLAWPDGGRVLVGHDGRQIRIEPRLFAGLTLAKVQSLIDARIDPRRRIPLPERAKAAIPSRWNSRLALRIVTLLLGGFSVLAALLVVLAIVQAGPNVGIPLALFSLPIWIGAAWAATAARRRRAFDVRPDIY